MDIFEALRASKAMPIAYNKKVTIEGIEYFDGALTATVAINIKEAIARGATTIITIDSNTKNPHWRIADRLTSRFLTKNVAQAMRNTVIDPPTIQAPEIRIIHVRPTKPLPVGFLDNNPEHVRATIDIGYNDMMVNEQIREYV